MATRMIPKSTKVKVEFIKGFNFGDIFVILFALVFLALAWTSGFTTIAYFIYDDNKLRHNISKKDDASN